MQNTDGYRIVTAVVQEIGHSNGMVHFKTSIGSFGLLAKRFEGAVFSNETVTLYIKGFSEIVGVQTTRGIAFYVKPDEYDDYTNELIERG